MSVIQPNAPKKSIGTQLKDIPVSKRSGLIKLVIILALSAILWLPPLIYIIITGSPIGIGQPPITDEASHVGYASFRLNTLNQTDGTYIDITGNVLIVSYENETTIIDNVTADGTTVYHIEQTSYGYTHAIQSTIIYDNRTFLIIANPDQTDPYLNVITLDEKTIAGDVELSLFDINGTHGDYLVSDLGHNNTLAFGLNSTNGFKTIGERSYTPEAVRPMVNFTTTGLYIEMDSSLELYAVNGIEGAFENINGLAYIVLPSLLFGEYKELSVLIVFEDSATLPTYMKIYDGFPMASDLIATLS